MLEYLKPMQSHNSILMSIALNVAMIMFVCVSIKLEGKKNIVFKIIFLMVLLFSTLTLFIGL